MIIELCGLPGAGKSTVARGLVAAALGLGREASLPLEEVSPRRARVPRVGRKLRRAAVEVIGHPGDAAGTVDAVARSGQPLTDVAIRSLNWLVLRAALRRSRGIDGIHVVDQGLVQELCSLGFRGDALAAIDVADPGDGSLGPDVVVLVDVDPALAEERLGGRPGRQSRVEGAGVDLPFELTRQRDLIEDLIDAWTTRFGDRVPTVVHRVEDHGDGVDPAGLLERIGLGEGRAGTWPAPSPAEPDLAPTRPGGDLWS